MSLEIGTVFGPYQIISELGYGGMGEVYRARDSRLGRDVALKVLRGATIRDADSRRRFAHEANAAGALNHPNIVAVFDVNLEVENPYIVTELVEGESLRKLLDRGPVPLRKLVDIAVQVADGMAAAHQAVDRAPRPEAGEHPADARRARQDRRLRAGEIPDSAFGKRRGRNRSPSPCRRWAR